MPFTTQAYCTRADVILALDPNMNQSDYQFIDSLIPQAQTDLDREIGYAFQQDGTIASPASRVYDGLGENWLAIDDLLSLQTGTPNAGCTTPQGASAPCGSVIETFQYAVLVNGVWVLGQSSTNDISQDIILRPNNFAQIGVPARVMVRRSGLPFQEEKQNYTVYGIFGEPILPGQIYPGVPADITRATIRLVIHYFKMRSTAYADLMQAQGGIREHYTMKWPDDVMAIVRKYRHQRFYTRAPGNEAGWAYYVGR